MRGVTRLASSSLRTTSATARSNARLINARRCFSSTPSPQATYGFIGIGQMGYRMAKNLREKLPATDTLLINDVNKDAVGKFVDELSGFTVVAAESPREIAERAVCSHPSFDITCAHLPFMMNSFVLSMI